MKHYLSILLLLVALVLSVSARDGNNNAGEGYKVETIGALSNEAVAVAVRGAMEDKGLRVTDAAGKTLCDVWFRKDIETVKAEIDGASFAQLQDGNLIGVINFPNATSDFRGQGVKAGWYTLRYAIMPVNGSHMGVAPGRDFFLLCGVGEDQDPQKLIRGEALIRLSTRATGAGHVSPWSLTYAAKEGLPKIETTEEGHVILEVALRTRSGDMHVGFTIVGRTEG